MIIWKASKDENAMGKLVLKSSWVPLSKCYFPTESHSGKNAKVYHWFTFYFQPLGDSKVK